MALLCEQFKVIGCGYTADYNDGYTAESINTEGLHSIMYILSFGAVSGNGVLTVKSGASDGVQTTAETFYYRYGGAAQGSASSDVYSAIATSSGLTLTGTTYTTRTAIVEIDCSTLTAGQPWVTLAIDNAASAGILHVVAVCVPRYPGNAIPTAI